MAVSPRTAGNAPGDTFPRLLGDVGGTNARFAIIAHAGADIGHVDALPSASFPSLLEAVRHYLAKHGHPAPRWCAIGIANPVVGDHLKMTNRAWSFSISELQRQLGLARLLVINDFTALALSLPVLDAAELRQVGGGTPLAGAPLALLGAGTGLGVSGLLPAQAGRRAIPVNGEGGHVTLAGVDEREDRVIAVLRGRFGHASAERALSGPGIENLYQAVCALAGVAPAAYSAPQITQHALAATDALCVEAMDLFFGFLGTVAGNLALSLGALGGLYIGGGIVPRLANAIDASRFRRSFEDKGRFQPYLAGIPAFVVQAKVSPALIGAARALEEL
jgi:glucokinase